MKVFSDFKSAVQEQFEIMSTSELFVTDISKGLMWDTYLSSYPEGTNPIYRERTEHDCQCCKQFIRTCGNVVSVVNNKLVSIWDIQVGGHYQVVANTLSNLVKSKEIKNRFFHYQRILGTDFNHMELEDNSIKRWDHFYFKLPSKFVKVKDTIGTLLSESKSSKDVFKRGLDEITPESINTVLELIAQDSIYRGQEHKHVVEKFLKLQNTYLELFQQEKDTYCWLNTLKTGARIRNTVIGTLLTDISDNVDLTKAVEKFEAKVAPENYKRPKALITKGMIDQAQKTVLELGIEESLARRYATIDDITVNNILFVDRETKKALNVFDKLKENVSVDVKKLKKVEEVNIQTFIDEILPKADSIELLFENQHINNLMSLISPQNPDAPNILKWDNNFSWAYNGEVTDSIKERVKKAGGNVGGVLRCSLSWFNYDDLDIHVKEPYGSHIYFNRPNNISTSGVLDVDMNAGCGISRNAVENITWSNKSKMQEGIYEVFIHQYQLRETIDGGFDAEIEYNGDILEFHYDKTVQGNVPVVQFRFSKETGITIISSLPTIQTAKEEWGITTAKFHKAKLIMNSPNYWNGKATGNKHYFFILENCVNENSVRGFFNEFLKENLTKHRKVFEVLGSKMKVEKAENQLSGLGFSSTQRNHIFCNVTGSFTRKIKITF